MERLIFLALFFLLVQCDCTKKTVENHSKTDRKEELNNSVNVAMEVPRDIDSAIQKEMPNASVFWMLEEMSLTSWPEDLEMVIKDNICKDQVGTKYCAPEMFKVFTINDSLKLIVDHSSYRTGTSGYHNYVYNTLTKNFVCHAVGVVQGIVKEKEFVGFTYSFRYIDENSSFQSYTSVEQILGDKAVTYKILSPNRFSSKEELNKDFDHFKALYFSDSIK